MDRFSPCIFFPLSFSLCIQFVHFSHDKYKIKYFQDRPFPPYYVDLPFQPNLFLLSIWRRQWHPTPVLLPRKSHGRRSLVSCNPWVAKSWTQLSYFTFTFHIYALEMEMATHSRVLAWRIPQTGETGKLPSMGSHRVGHN